MVEIITKESTRATMVENITICDRLKVEGSEGGPFLFDLTNSSTNSGLWLFKP